MVAKELACRAVARRRSVAALAALAAALVGCGPPVTGSAGAEALLYVANKLDGTVTRIDASTGRAIGAPLPVGAAPVQVLASPEGHLLVLPLSPDQRNPPTLATPTLAGWTARPLRLETGARAVLGAGGGHHALLVYELDSGAAGEGSRCRLVLVDLRTGESTPPRTVCGGTSSVVGLALDASPRDDPIAYLAIWRRPESAGDCDAPTDNRIVAVRARTGAVVATVPLVGVPDRLTLALAPGGPGNALYAVEAAAIPGGGLPDECRYMTHSKYVTNARSWAVLSLAPDTLAVQRQAIIRQAPYALAVAPDGDHVYALVHFHQVLHLDLASGSARRLATLPSAPLGLAVTDTRIYVSDSAGSTVRALNRSTGRLVQVVATGRHPTGITLASPAYRGRLAYAL
jgi:streptogramin lyase